MKLLFKISTITLGLLFSSNAFSSNDSAAPILAPPKTSSVLLPAQTQELAISSFTGLSTTETLEQLVKTPSCYAKKCYIKCPEVRAAYRAFFMDQKYNEQQAIDLEAEENGKTKTAHNFRLKLAEVLSSISIPDYVEATTLVCKPYRLRESVGNLLSGNKSLVISIEYVQDQEKYVYWPHWIKNDESYKSSHNDAVYESVGRSERNVRLFDNSYGIQNQDGHYLKSTPSFLEAKRHLAYLLRNENRRYHSKCDFYNHNANPTPIIFWLYQTIMQSTKHQPSDYDFLQLARPDSLYVNVHKVSYWLHQFILLTPNDVNTQTPISVNPDFFRKHNSIAFNGHSFADMIMKITNQTKDGIAADKTDLFWLACATLQMKDSYIASQGENIIGRPGPHFIAYMKIVHQIFEHLAHTGKDVEIKNESAIIAGTISTVLPLMENIQEIIASNPQFISKLSPQAQMFVQTYLIAPMGQQAEERSEQEEEIASSLL